MSSEGPAAHVLQPPEVVAASAGPLAFVGACSQATCSHAISTRLSRKLAIFTMVVLGVLFTVAWGMVKMILVERNTADLAARCELITDVVGRAADQGEAAVLARLLSDAPMRATTRLEVWRADGSLLFADQDAENLQRSAHTQVHDFTIKTPALAGGQVKARYTVDYARDAAMGTRWAWMLFFVTLAAGALVAFGARWHVRRGLSPLRELAAQTRAISARDLDRRLALADPAEELLPWIEQFNALMQRLEGAYAQLEGFNADVAHELRTPLTTLIGQTELALSRERSVDSLRDTLVSNLEEMQRLAGMVNDMLFLSQADRGAVARRGRPASLAALAQQVVEFHEATLEDAGLELRVQGDAMVAVDEPLFKRALSNLLGNATRFARRGSTVLIQITARADGQAQVVVINSGEPIDPKSLPRLFDRFFRADASRCCDGETHHGLGLAIVAAIARMHDGHTVAESQGGFTSVGFTLATAP
ncbi:MAG: heavy metal sensor histidine kinase [Rubrivivax sp.]|nr:heavy metal sensor histidine kinase [Rubrivivax sp.]